MDVKDLMKNKEKLEFVFFWKNEEPQDMPTKACLCQWYECTFEVDGQVYCNAEQFMMAEKARIMDDEATRKMILAESDPLKIKKLGRIVKNFNPILWDKIKQDVVIKGNYHKFSQNENLRGFLISTGNKILVEASPLDTVWGIGLDEANPDATNPAKWKGQNLLGFALMKVREMVR